MAKISIGQFKELHPTMRTYIIRRYMVAGFLLLLISSIGIFTKSWTPVLFGVVIGCGYAAYVTVTLISLLLNRCRMFEGVVVKTSGDISGGKLKTAKNMMTKKPVRPEIVIRTFEEKILLHINLHEKNDFNEDNKVTVFVPVRSIYQKAEDYFTAGSYYVITKDYEMYSEVVEDDGDENETYDVSENE